MDEDGLERETPSVSQVLRDGILAITAGADTAATVLTNLLYLLLTHPTDYKHLREEVDKFFPAGDGDPFDSLKLAKMPYLNAVMQVRSDACYIILKG